ncbi:MAG: LamG domain-containing protein, partial [Sedimentisphaerales bacterium]|nr:LamG domain-containing protein [Sedimentisphaerales bacterium]
AVSSNTPSSGACVADFSDVTTTGSVTGQWTAADIGGENPANTPDTMYIVVTDSSNKSKTIIHPNAKATCVADWTQWLIPLKDFTGVNMAAVKKMVIGFGNRTSPTLGGAGMLFIDDIQYGRPILPVGLVAQYSMEDNANDSSGNGHDGTIVGSPTFVNGPAGKGKAIQFSGAVGQYIDLGTYNPSAMTGKLSVSLWAQWKGPTGLYQGLVAKRDYWNTTDTMWQIEGLNTTGALYLSRNGSYPPSGNPILPVGEWAHVAVTFDKVTARFYVNGAMTGQGAFSFGPGKEASMHIGCCDVNGSNPFNGAIDEVRLYDVTLTDAEVRALAGK